MMLARLRKKKKEKAVQVKILKKYAAKSLESDKFKDDNERKTNLWK